MFSFHGPELTELKDMVNGQTLTVTCWVFASHWKKKLGILYCTVYLLRFYVEQSGQVHILDHRFLLLGLIIHFITFHTAVLVFFFFNLFFVEVLSGMFRCQSILTVNLLGLVSLLRLAYKWRLQIALFLSHGIVSIK